MPKDFTYTSQEGNHISISLYGWENFDTQPCLIYLHGFKGFKDWGFVPYAGKYFEERGMSFLAFNFSHNGIGEDGLNFTEVKKFEKNTFSLEISEALEIIQLATHTNFFGKDLRNKLGLIGHSRGGGLAILAGKEAKEVSAVATWAAVSTFERYPKEDRQKWKKKGYQEVKNSRTGQVFKLGLELLDDIEKNGKSRLNILKNVRELKKPLLVLHGQEDETIPFFEAEHINVYADVRQTTLRLIPNAGHTFGAKHPFEGSNPALDELLELTYEFFLEKF